MKLWFDLCHPPHAMLFAPIIHGLILRGHDIWVTYRERYQVRELMESHGLKGVAIGKDYGSNKSAKAVGLMRRSLGLAKAAKGQGIDLAISQGSSYQVIAAKMLGIRSLFMTDYEHIVWAVAKLWAHHIAVPEMIPVEVLMDKGLPLERVHRYPGLKEEVYLEDFKPDEQLPERMGWDRRKIWAVLRPPEIRAHYHSEKTTELYTAVTDLLKSREDVLTIVLPRNPEERHRLSHTLEVKSGCWVVPPVTLSGPDLIYNADLIVGAGGTMNREAAVLGVPVYSVFLGPRPSIDEALARQGRMTLLTRVEELDQITFEKRRRQQTSWPFAVRHDLMNYIESLAG